MAAWLGGGLQGQASAGLGFKTSHTPLMTSAALSNTLMPVRSCKGEASELSSAGPGRRSAAHGSAGGPEAGLSEAIVREVC